MKEMFDILRASLFTNEDVSLPDWQPVFKEMKIQTVAALPGVWLTTHLDAKPWLNYSRLKQAQWIRVMHEQDQLLKLLEEHDIPCVILKGAAAAMAYPHPTLRTMGDVDFLVKRDDFEKAEALLEANGYVSDNKKAPDKHHYGYHKNQVRFELHKRIPLIPESDESWMRVFEDGISAREWHETEGYRFPVLPPVLNGLVLIFHINQHLRTGLGLRQIIDWMMYIHTLPEDKRKELMPLVEKTGQMKLARTVTLLCQRYLGLEKLVEEDASLPVEELLAYIVEKGNFGLKAGLDGNIVTFTLLAPKVGGVLKRLQKGGLSRWKAAQKHALLRPFAWIYQGIRLCGVMIKNKKSPKAILEQTKKGNAHRQLLSDLELPLDRTITH